MVVDIKNLEDLSDKKDKADIQAKDIMEKSVLFIKEDYSIKSCVEFLKVNKISGAPVVNEHGTLIGVISEYDMLIQASATDDLSQKIQINKKVIAAREEDTLKTILVTVLKNKIKRIPVINQHKKVVGIISRIDLLDKLIRP